MDWSRTETAKYLVKFSYIGTDYQGVAYQNECIPTVELFILRALLRTCLIQSRETCDFSRCGRTDKGVHAAGNYFTAKLRVGSKNKTLEYCKMINACLPDSIRVIVATRVADNFDARFSCTARTYHYYFGRRQLDLGLMEKAAKQLEGAHDFRNFCKMDVDKTTNYMRTIHHITFASVNKEIMVCEIRGSAFLWHMVRCIMAVLFAVGKGQENPDIVEDLLDVEQCPCKPNYDLADPSGLVLLDAEFRDSTVVEPSVKGAPEVQVYRIQHERALRDAAILSCLAGGDTDVKEPAAGYTLLRKRGVGLSLDEALQRAVKRRPPAGEEPVPDATLEALGKRPAV